MSQDIPTRDGVRSILAAAADVLFSDGVSSALLDQWTDETIFVLSVQRAASTPRMPRMPSTPSGGR